MWRPVQDQPPTLSAFPRLHPSPPIRTAGRAALEEMWRGGINCNLARRPVRGPANIPRPPRGDPRPITHTQSPRACRPYGSDLCPHFHHICPPSVATCPASLDMAPMGLQGSLLVAAPPSPYDHTHLPTPSKRILITSLYIGPPFCHSHSFGFETGVAAILQ